MRTLGSTTAYRRSTTRLQRATKNAASSVTPRTLGRSLAPIASTAYLPSPARLNARLGEHRAADQQAEVQAEDREHRRERAAQAVLDHHPALSEALGPRGADVVLVHRLEHARPG